MSHIEDRLLWEKFQTGDNGTYAYIYEKYIRDLFFFGKQFSSDRELIKDCIQDVFIKIYKNRKNLGAVNNIKVYLFISLKNSLLNELKKDQNWIEWIDNIHPDIFCERDIEDSYIENEERALQSAQLNKVIKDLTPKQRKVIYYRFVQCLSIPEIQELMGINYQSVTNLIHRSISKIKKNIVLVSILIFITVLFI